MIENGNKKENNRKYFKFTSQISFKKKSIYYLLAETGYFENYNVIKEDDIFEVLSCNQNFIDEWLMWSNSKRVSSGWYFQKNEDGRFKIGYFPSKGNLQEVEFSSPIEACTAFIKREIEEIRDVRLS